MIRNLFCLVYASLLMISVGCSGGGDNKIQPTIANPDGTGERPAMQTGNNGAQVDRGVRMDVSAERRSPPQ
jgi:hypothetical protein